MTDDPKALEPVNDDQRKAVFESKTIWSQIVMGVLVLSVPGFSAWVAANPDAYVACHAAITILARLIGGKLKLPKMPWNK